MLKPLLFTIFFSINCYSYETRICTDFELNRMSAPGPGPGLEWLYESISSLKVSFNGKFKIEILDKNDSVFRSFINCYHKNLGDYAVNITCYPKEVTPEQVEGVYNLRLDRYTTPRINPSIVTQLQFDDEATTLIGIFEWHLFSRANCHYAK